jgi:hypothetical protein
MSDRVKIIQDLYSDKYRDYQADFICCRHTLEHVLNPEDLLQPLRKAIGDRLNTVVFFEVPNGLHTFRNLAIWDILYEHCCYYVSTSLIHAFTHNEFAVTDVRETFDGQFLCIEAIPVEPGHEKSNNSSHQSELAALNRDITEFTTKFQSIVTTWQKNLDEIANKKQKAVVWGAGSKGVTFLNIFKNQKIEYIVDLNPRKHGMFVAGSGQKIIPPEFLKDYQPDVVIIMNPIYKDEIRQLTQSLGVNAELICV